VLRAARVSVALVFLIHGMIVSNWLARIPAVQATLHLSNAVLGLALLGASGGAFVSMLGVSHLISHFGSARVTFWSSIGFCAVLPAPALAWNATSLGLTLFIYGLFAGSMDVAMNTQAVDVERFYKRPVMVGFHALFSLGGMIGSATGGFSAGQGIAPLPHLTMGAVLLSVAVLLSTRRLLPDAPEVIVAQHTPPLPFRPLLALGVIAFCILLGEGAMADWSAVYLTQFTGQGTATTGYAVFSLTMAGGRFAGDWLRSRLGSVWLVRLGGALAAVGVGLGLVLGHALSAVIGFACAGAGFSTIFPITLSAAGHKAMPRPEAGVATVAALGYVALLAGPPAIGLLSELITLRGALALVVVLSFTCTALAGFVREADDAVGLELAGWRIV
jgi:MFS family permease